MELQRPAQYGSRIRTTRTAATAASLHLRTKRNPVKNITKALVGAGIAATALIGFAAPANAATTTAATPTVYSPANGATATSNPISVMGNGEPGRYIEVTLDGAGRCGTTVTAAGWYYCAFNKTDDPQGAHTLVARQFNADATAVESTSAASKVTFAWDGSKATRFATSNGAQFDAKRPVFSGVGQPGDTVNLSVDGRGVAGTIVKADGTWEMSPTIDMSTGKHLVSAGTTAKPGQTISVTILDTPVIAPAIAGGALLAALAAAGVVAVRRRRAMA
jgi:large repetitive protein